jgi:hypothetical protein
MEKESAKTIVKVLSILTYIGGSFFILGGLIMIFMRNLMASMMPRMMMGYSTINVPAWTLVYAFSIMGAILLALGIFKIFVAFGLWNFKKWSRMAELVLAVLSLVMFPFGTVYGILVLYLLGFNNTIIKLFRN